MKLHIPRQTFKSLNSDKRWAIAYSQAADFLAALNQGLFCITYNQGAVGGGIENRYGLVAYNRSAKHDMFPCELEKEDLTGRVERKLVVRRFCGYMEANEHSLFVRDTMREYGITTIVLVKSKDSYGCPEDYINIDVEIGEGLSCRTRLDYPFGSWSPEILEILFRASGRKYAAGSRRGSFGAYLSKVLSIFKKGV